MRIKSHEKGIARGKLCYLRKVTRNLLAILERFFRFWKDILAIFATHNPNGVIVGYNLGVR